MLIHVRGLVIDTQCREGGVINLVVRADQKHASAFGRLRQYLAHALFRAGDLCNPSNDHRALRVVQAHVQAKSVDDVLPNRADPHLAEVLPLNLPNGDAYYNPLLVHEGVKQHQHGFWRNALNRLRGQKGTYDLQSTLPKVVLPDGTEVILLPAIDVTQ